MRRVGRDAEQGGNLAGAHDAGAGGVPGIEGRGVRRCHRRPPLPGLAVQVPQRIGPQHLGHLAHVVFAAAAGQHAGCHGQRVQRHGERGKRLAHTCGSGSGSARMPPFSGGWLTRRASRQRRCVGASRSEARLAAKIRCRRTFGDLIVGMASVGSARPSAIRSSVHFSEWRERTFTDGCVGASLRGQHPLGLLAIQRVAVFGQPRGQPGDHVVIHGTTPNSMQIASTPDATNFTGCTHATALMTATGSSASPLAAALVIGRHRAGPRRRLPSPPILAQHHRARVVGQADPSGCAPSRARRIPLSMLVYPAPPANPTTPNDTPPPGRCMGRSPCLAGPAPRRSGWSGSLLLFSALAPAKRCRPHRPHRRWRWRSPMRCWAD